jgi:hypothetical protein
MPDVEDMSLDDIRIAPLSALYSLLSALCILCSLLSGLCSLVSALFPLLSALYSLRSALCSLLSAICPLLSAFCSLFSALCSLLRLCVILAQFPPIPQARNLSRCELRTVSSATSGQLPLACLWLSALDPLLPCVSVVGGPDIWAQPHTQRTWS